MAKLVKVTSGSVYQTFDTKTKKWIAQEFIAGDFVEFTDEDGHLLSDNDLPKIEGEYLPFDMKQPS